VPHNTAYGVRVMFTVEVPCGADGHPLLPADVWHELPPVAQAVIVALAQQVVALAAEVRDLKARLGQNTTNSSRPPSSTPPQTPRRPAASPTGRARGGQPGHVAHQRTLVPPERVDFVVTHRPATCAHCAAHLPALVLRGLGEDFVRHQVTELPPVRAVVTEQRLHRMTCAGCGHRTRATLPSDVPGGVFGPRLQATVAVLSGQYHLSQRQVADVCGTVLNAPLAASSVAGSTAAATAPRTAPCT